MKNRKSEKQGQSLYRKMGMVFALFASVGGGSADTEIYESGVKAGKCIGAKCLRGWKL